MPSVARSWLPSLPKLAVVFTLLAVPAPQAQAATIGITSGYVLVASGVFGAASIDVAGDHGFTFTSVLDRQSVVDARACGQWELCGPGSVLSLGATWSGLDLRGAVATLDGVTYPQVGGANSPNQLRFDLEGSATMPAFGAATSRIVMAPFTLTGGFWYAPGLLAPGQFAELSGQGMASLQLRRGTGDFSDTWVYDGIRYDFGSSSSAPVPEPSTFLLVGGGIAALIGRMRRRA